MDLTPTARACDLRERLVDFMQGHVLPAEPVAAAHHAAHPTSWGQPPVMKDLKAEARRRGLWNLALPTLGEPDAETVVGLTNLEYAPLAEITGWSPHLAPEALNCSPPDTGNMEILARFGTPEQRRRWLAPLLAGEIRSIFSMTEPDVASSDATNIRLAIRDDGDSWVLDGRKWWSTAALRAEAAVAMVMGVTDPEAAPGGRHSLVLVPTGTPGMRVLRSTTVLGFADRYEGGHGEIAFEGCRVPKENLLGDRGAGFAIAQTRLGPGRIHHCMRLIGSGERAIAAMVARARTRTTWGVPLAEQGVIQQYVADARVELDAARLLVLRAAWRMDRDGAKAARHDIAAAKVKVPATVKRIVDDAIQVRGGAGLSQDTVLARLYAHARFLQIADGPDEVHRRSLARAEFGAEPLFVGA